MKVDASPVKPEDIHVQSPQAATIKMEKYVRLIQERKVDKVNFTRTIERQTKNIKESQKQLEKMAKDLQMVLDKVN